MMDENPINPNDKTPETEPIAAPDDINDLTSSLSEPEPIETTSPIEPEPTVEPVEEPAVEPAPEPVAEPEPTPISEPVITPEPVATPTMEPTQPMMNQFPQKKKHTGMIVGVIIAILLIAVGVVLCVILLNSTNKPSENSNNNDNSNSSEQAENTEEEEEEEESTISCVSTNDTWSYTVELTIDNRELKTTKMIQSLELFEDFETETLEDDKTEIAGIVSSFSQIDTMKTSGIEMAGVTYISTGTAGEPGWTAKITLDRSKIKSEEILEQFENVDGKSAKELKEAADEEGSAVCTIK